MATLASRKKCDIDGIGQIPCSGSHFSARADQNIIRGVSQVSPSSIGLLLLQVGPSKM